MTNDSSLGITVPKCLVVGGSGAIGAAVCRRLATDGADIALAYRSNREEADRIANLASSSGHRCFTESIDLTDHVNTVKTVDRVVGELGGLDAAISAIGILPPQEWTSQIEVDVYRQHMEAEAVGFFAFVKAVIPHLREKGGSLVAVGSIAARHHVVRDVLSGSPKAAMESVVRGIAREEGRYGIRANIVGVGILADGMAAELVESGEVALQALETTAESLPLRRLGTAEDIAEAVAFLVSSEASYITGQSLDVDGGYSI